MRAWILIPRKPAQSIGKMLDVNQICIESLLTAFPTAYLMWHTKMEKCSCQISRSQHILKVETRQIS